MINKLKDFLGIKRKVSISIYAVGYMSNISHVADVEVYYSMRYIKNYGLAELAFAHLDRKRKVNFPRYYCQINE